MEKRKIYYVGIDIGTGSVGWAVTDKNYKLYKFNGHKMWGVRLFEEAKTAEDRRIQRASRRRLARRKARIDLLQELMAEEINKVDPGFYQRLEDSKFYTEDKSVKEKHSLFVGEEYNDIDFYKEFPTIYHLRTTLMKGNKQYDIRLIYLALHHIIKNRGHFLYEGDSFKTASLDEIIKEVLVNTDVYTEELEINDELINNLKTIMLNTNRTTTDRKKQISLLLKKSKQLTAIFSLAIGRSESLAVLYNDDEYKGLESNVSKISFSKRNYEEARGDYEEILGDKIILLDSLKQIYDSVILTGIKKEGISLSQSKVEQYNKHKKELKKLKILIKEYDEKEYEKVFTNTDKKIANYTNYVGRGDSKCSREDFYTYLKKILSKIKKDSNCEIKNKEIAEILHEIEVENYLPLQRVKENGAIPYQLHKEELELILDNASRYFEFLNDGDELSIKEKIISIMTFRIPYYVGPINTYHKRKKGGFSWAIKKTDEKTYPWNFNQVINLEASHEEFIKGMISKCSFLKGENVLPKNSLLYTEYMLLNELNNIKCNGIPITIEVRDLIIEKMFKDQEFRGKRTINKIKTLLIHEGLCDKDVVITGIDNEVKADIKSYREFKKILADRFNYNMVEDLIRWITIYSEDKKSIKKRIEENYKYKLNEEDIKKILRLNYKDWGRLSKKLLIDVICEKCIDYSTGEIGNIINTMRNTTNNFMELMSNMYSFKEQIDTMNIEGFNPEEELSHKMLDDLYVSPGVKRQIWQAIQITEEIKKIMGGEPEKIFIETTRSNKAGKKRTNTRQQRLLELYAACKKECKDFSPEIKKKTDGQLRSKRLYLYYLQMGKCMYSGATIDLDRLMSGLDYDIDHIYPRSKTKDNSFNNLVLVKNELNRHKDDNYPIDNKIQKNMSSYWNFLYQKGFISPKKYNRLTRTSKLTNEELADFINRQLIETSQSAKVIAEMMTNIYKDSDVVYVKAENVSDFRNQMGFIKVRDINDLHHAKDAYLNIVVGNVYDTKFTKSPARYIKEAKFREYSLNKMFDFRVERNGYVAWDGKGGETFKKVKAEMRSNDVRVTRRIADQKGPLFKATIYNKDVAKKGLYLGTKLSDPRLADVERYGGYKDISIAYYQPYKCKIKETKGEITERRSLAAIPIYLSDSLEGQAFEDYIKEDIKLKKNEELLEFNIIDSKLRIGTLIKYDGFFYRIGGKTGNAFYIDSALQLYLEEDAEKYFKEIFKFISIQKIDKDIMLEDFSNVINENKNLEIYNTLVSKMGSNIYLKSKKNKYEDLRKEETIDIFKKMNLLEQIETLVNILNVLTNNVTTYDLKSLKHTTSRKTVNFDLTKADEFKIINQSITGLYSNEKDLMV